MSVEEDVVVVEAEDKIERDLVLMDKVRMRTMSEEKIRIGEKNEEKCWLLKRRSNQVREDVVVAVERVEWAEDQLLNEDEVVVVDRRQKKKVPKVQTVSYSVVGRGGAMIKYKKKIETKPLIEEDTERSPKVTKPKYVKTSGPHWEKKEDLQQKKEIDAAMNASKEQKETRSVLNDIFKKVDDGKGIEEDELIEKIKQKLNRTKKTVSALSQNAQNKLTESANGIILAMKSGFLAEDYSVELDNTYGTRTYFQKKE